ncbi:hypothetical protein HYV71_02950 [Candidatus Uhrbacteria bacterium]|nr:hypothetical protein [Candidatus Uhrbacteria bacterium]
MFHRNDHTRIEIKRKSELLHFFNPDSITNNLYESFAEVSMVYYFRKIYESLFYRSVYFLLFTLAGFAANVLIWLLIALGFETLRQPERDFIILHYKVPVGPDLYWYWYGVFILPIAGFLFIIVNYFLARFVHQFFQRSVVVLPVTAFVCQLLLIRAVYLIIQINLY